MSDIDSDRDDEAPGSTIDPENYDAAEELDQLEAEDSLTGGEDPLETGYSPPERPLGMREELTLDERLAEEVPENDADRPWDDTGDLAGGDGEPLDDQVGDRRSGRLVAPDEGTHADAETDLVAEDVGIDGGAASAEEAAVHIVDETYEAETVSEAETAYEAETADEAEAAREADRG